MSLITRIINFFKSLFSGSNQIESTDLEDSVDSTLTETSGADHSRSAGTASTIGKAETSLTPAGPAKAAHTPSDGGTQAIEDESASEPDPEAEERRLAQKALDEAERIEGVV
mgnify:CR=1 FL=1